MMVTDFFDRQEQARRRTRWLVFYFAAAVLFIAGAVYLALQASFYVAQSKSANRLWEWDLQLLLYSVVGTLVVIAGGTFYKLLELRAGGSAVATSLGGQPISADVNDPAIQRLLNVVEEMALASGTSVPQVYVLEQEDGINAFAAGHTPSDAAIGVTRGTLRHLNRDELQGVVAHEFSHILNGDMRLNLRLIGVLHGILCLAILGRILLETARYSRSSSRNRKGGNPLPLLGLALLLIGSMGVFFGRLIKSAVSRQREYLADAAAVQFTRNPSGLAGALKKIGGLADGAQLSTGASEEASHLFFGNALSESWFALLSTHPPLAERIRALDPSFDGRFAVTQPVVERDSETAGAVHRVAASARPIPMPGAIRREPPPTLKTACQGAAGRLGNVGPGQLAFASALLQSLPEELAAAAREPRGATVLVHSLVLGQDNGVRRRQLALVGPIAPEMEACWTKVVALAPAARLALADLALPALRRLSPSQYEHFAATLKALVEADQEIDLFEYTLQRIVRQRLETYFRPPKRQVIQYYALKPLDQECSVLLSALAHVGHEDPAEQAAAFRAGWAALRLASGPAEPLALSECGLAFVDTALDRLAAATPAIKRLVIDACAETVAADGFLHEREAELLRAVADTLDCPLPPFVQPSAASQAA